MPPRSGQGAGVPPARSTAGLTPELTCQHSSMESAESDADSRRASWWRTITNDVSRTWNITLPVFRLWFPRFGFEVSLW